MSSSSASSGFVLNDTVHEVNRYMDEICAEPKFLCSNRELCSKNTTLYPNIDNVNKICEDIDNSLKCDTDFKECRVSTINTYDEDKNIITTSFVNIILPIPDAVDKHANQKFLRLPPLSSGKNPKSTSSCNVCACMNRFSSSPGASAVINEKSFTSPGQDTCIYPDFIEHYYYPVSIQNLNTKLKDSPKVVLGKYNVINSNIIFARSEEDLEPANLYDLLTKNGITEKATINFITNKLYKNDEAKTKQLQVHILTKSGIKTKNIKYGRFMQDMSFSYIVLVLFLCFIILIK